MESRYLSFIETKRKPKTQTWEVWSRGADEGGKNEDLLNAGVLGNIQWFGAWRCYAFYPCAGTIFEKQCLRDIARFLEEQTTGTRATWKKRKAG